MRINQKHITLSSWMRNKMWEILCSELIPTFYRAVVISTETCCGITNRRFNTAGIKARYCPGK
jgi:hypothetical protein